MGYEKPMTSTAEDAPELLWDPSPEHVAGTRIAAFRAWLGTERGMDLPDYRALWRWSVSDLEGFWSSVAEFFDVRFHRAAHRVLTDRSMPGAEWFPGATLNYAEQALSAGPGKGEGDLAVLFSREDGRESELTYGELRRRVAAARAGLIELGVRRGDRVAALSPNCPETLIAFLAAASLGATWSSCSPDFGARAIADRFVQIEPKVLLAVDGHVYGGREFDIRSTVDEIRDAMPGLAGTVLIDYVGAGSVSGCVRWDDLLERHRGAELDFDPVPFDHPLWVVYSSGTTGLPKGIVHGHGGMTLEHLKALGLHCDLGPDDRFFWFTTTGWMMWNFLVGGLLVGTTVVLYDGSPAHPCLSTLWEFAAQRSVTYFGTSAPYVQSCAKRGLRPKDELDLSALRTVGSTGSPLSSEGFRWLADAVGEVQIASVSGGTDLCTAFLGAAPDVPVWLGEISCPMLGAAVTAYDESGRELDHEVGELVITEPMPTMPIYFWNDPDGSRLREAYFDAFPGVWRHGDWVRFTERGTAVIYGRSDSTLNRGGIRMGTAEFYRVVEALDEVADSLVIDTSGAGGPEGELVCFLVLEEGAELGDVKPQLKKRLREELSPRHVPNRFFVVSEVPRTLNGKKLEVPVKKILAGTAPERAVSSEALSNPASLTPFVQLSKGDEG